jgi:hypothetical protein
LTTHTKSDAGLDMPARPTLIDIYNRRLMTAIRDLPFPPAKHMIQCATLALNAGAGERTVLGSAMDAVRHLRRSGPARHLVRPPSRPADPRVPARNFWRP